MCYDFHLKTSRRKCVTLEIAKSQEVNYPHTLWNAFKTEVNTRGGSFKVF